jgi:radical SAM superfamily enzyme YgiQ (UPF0313 family)
MKKVKVFSTQFNYQYGSVIHFPYSIASLFAYIRKYPDLAAKYQFEKTFVLRNKFEEYVARSKDVDILICSCYTWNWEITNLIAKQIKSINPNCLVIFGGPQVPLQYEGDVPRKWVNESKGSFFQDYPHVDMLVHQEGEITLKEIFEAYARDRDYSKINGIETKDFRTPPRDRIMDLDILPSPYLTNLVWELVEPVEGVSYIASWETNRGCPFQCTFCDWGSATKSKVRKRSMETLLKEIEWFADNKIPYVDICDANFGIFEDRDLEIARKLKSEKMSKGFPERIGIAWAKASSERVIQIARELLEADLLRAVTLAVQSLDPSTLNIIKRSNIKFDKFSNLLQEFRKNKIENYTEIIMGMPGETLKSYKNGLEQLMELFPRPVIFIYNCGIFVNAPMNQPSYIEAHGIKVIKSPIYLWHSSIFNRGEIAEYDNIAISSNTFDSDDLKKMFIYGWTTQAFHSLGTLEYISKFYNQIHGMKYIPFYENLVEYCESTQGLFSNEYRILLDYMETGYKGEGWDHYDPNLAPIFWPIEEATWLRCVTDSSFLELEILNYLRWFEKKMGYNTEDKILEDLVQFQVFILSTMDRKEPLKSQTFQYGWKDFFANKEGAGIQKLEKGFKTYSWENKVNKEDRAEWCYKAIWVGRNQGNYKCHPEFLLEAHQSHTIDAASFEI